MEILSYPIGLLVGLFPIAASLGPSKAPAHLLLDGRPVCELTERSPGCMVDLGRDPRVHLLELLRTDAAGQVTERVRRWVNRPGIDSEILVSGDCDEAVRRCGFDITWAHPLRLDPKRIDLTLDGAPVWHGNGKERHASVALGAKARPAGSRRRRRVSGRYARHVLAHALRGLSRGSAGRAPGRAAPPLARCGLRRVGGGGPSVVRLARPHRRGRRDRRHVRHAADRLRRSRRFPGQDSRTCPARTRKRSERSRAPTSVST